MRHFRKSYLLFLFLFSAFIYGCSKKEQSTNDIPVVPVNFSINPNSTEYLDLNVVNGWVTLTGGYRGIIVFRKSVSDFTAFERACPYDWQNSNARINVDKSGITAICPVCNSKFVLLDGSPYQGPSPYPLKQYQTSYDGVLLYIFN